LKWRLRLGGEAIEDHEADIVAGVFVLAARVAEANDEAEVHEEMKVSVLGEGEEIFVFLAVLFE
jgi:hypothetical protein